jgi:hypothetical protein
LFEFRFRTAYLVFIANPNFVNIGCSRLRLDNRANFLRDQESDENFRPFSTIERSDQTHLIHPIHQRNVTDNAGIVPQRRVLFEA